MSEIQNSSIFALDDISDEEMNNLIDGTVTDFDEGDLVTGTVVKIERDEVLLDIGYKSEGVIPSRELSIRKDVNPADVVAMNDEIEALVLQRRTRRAVSSSPRSVPSTSAPGTPSRRSSTPARPSRARSSRSSRAA